MGRPRSEATAYTRQPLGGANEWASKLTLTKTRKEKNERIKWRDGQFQKSNQPRTSLFFVALGS